MARALRAAVVTAVIAGAALAWSSLTFQAPAIAESQKPAAEAPADRPSPSKETLLKLRKFCEADAKRLCPDVKPGGGRILHCLEARTPDLSAACREAIAPPPTKP